MRFICGSVLALSFGAAAPLAVFAQDSTRTVPEVRAEVSVTNGVEGAEAKAPVVLPSPSCPLTPNQLKSVRAGVGGAFIGGNA